MRRIASPAALRSVITLPLVLGLMALLAVGLAMECWLDWIGEGREDDDRYTFRDN